MSATLPDNEFLAKWSRATKTRLALPETIFRPCSIRTYIVPMKRKPTRGPQRYDEHREDHGWRLFRKSPISDPISSSYSLVFSVLQLFKILARREDFAVVLPISRLPENCLGRRTFGPGGTPQEISRGQARASGRGPRLPRQTGHAPAGHRRSFWRRPRRSVSATTRRLGPVGPLASDQHPGPFLRCPAGARSDPARYPGAASAGADLPPANLLRCPSGTEAGCSCTDQGKPLARDWRYKLARLRLRRPVFIVSLWSTNIGSTD